MELSVVSWLAIGYAALLLLVAYGIDLMAKRSARKVEQMRSGGFVYHEDHDAWVCPEDQWLWPRSFDPDNRVMRYRASPTVCNACPVRDTCTSSHGGREVQRNIDPWPASESARFHRGIACTVTVLAMLWPLVTAIGRPAAEAAVMVGVCLVVIVASIPLWAHWWSTPVDPTGVLQLNSDENVADREAVAVQQVRRRTSYRSDRLADERTSKGGLA